MALNNEMYIFMPGTRIFKPFMSSGVASGLNLVTAAIVLWNTVYLERATQGLVEAGKPVDGELLQFLSPLGWEHINLTGDYVWRQSRRLEDGTFRPLRMPGKP